MCLCFTYTIYYVRFRHHNLYRINEDVLTVNKFIYISLYNIICNSLSLYHLRGGGGGDNEDDVRTHLHIYYYHVSMVIIISNNNNHHKHNDNI